MTAMLAMLSAAGLPIVTASNGRGAGTTATRSPGRSRNCAGARLHEALGGVSTLGGRVLALIRIGETTRQLSSLLEEASRDAEEASPERSNGFSPC